MAKVQKYLSCYGITVECDVPDPVPSTTELINEGEGEREVLSNEIEEDIATAEESSLLVENLAEQADENQEVLDNPAVEVTEQMVQEANTAFLLTLGRLGSGTDYLKTISIGQESYRDPRTNLQVTQEGIVDSIKNFFKKIWEWIKGIFAKIAKLFGFKKKQTESAENAIAESGGNPEGVADMVKDAEELPKPTIICGVIMGNLGNEINAFSKRTPGDPSGPLKNHVSGVIGFLKGQNQIEANDFTNLSPFRKMDGQNVEKKVADIFGITLKDDDRLLCVTDRHCAILTRDADGNSIINKIPIDKILEEGEKQLTQKLSVLQNVNKNAQVFKLWQDNCKQHMFSNQQEKLDQQADKFLKLYSNEIKALENAADNAEKPQGITQAKLNIVNTYLQAYDLIFEQLWFLAKSGVKLLTANSDTVDDTKEEEPKKSSGKGRKKL